jgi:glutathione synthase/RimK-type ligase-like ATP-grasp enzyme
MLVGIHEAEYGKHGYERFQTYREILKYNNIPYVDLHIDQLDFWEKVKKCDLFIYRWSHIDRHKIIAQTILPIIEREYKINCFPNQKTCWHFDDKIKQYYLLKAYGFPITHSSVFFDEEDALIWADKTVYPKVFKLIGGAGSLNVALIKSSYQAKKVIKRMFGRGVKTGDIPIGNVKYLNFNNFIRKTLGPIYYRYKTGLKDNWQKQRGYVLFQDFLPNNDFDTRVTIIGDRAFAFIRKNRKNDFRSSGSGLIEYDNNNINPEMIKISFEICKKLEFQTMAFDFLYNGQKIEFCEISYSYDDKAIYNSDGYWDPNLTWHKGHYWPQFCHLSDLLKKELQQPEIKLYK